MGTKHAHCIPSKHSTFFDIDGKPGAGPGCFPSYCQLACDICHLNKLYPPLITALLNRQTQLAIEMFGGVMHNLAGHPHNNIVVSDKTPANFI